MIQMKVDLEWEWGKFVLNQEEKTSREGEAQFVLFMQVLDH